MDSKAPVNKKTWEEFRESKMLWWINMILHTFGWAIVFEPDTGNAYPARVKFRGFDEDNNSEGYIGVTEYMKTNAEEPFKGSERIVEMEFK